PAPLGPNLDPLHHSHEDDLPLDARVFTQGRGNQDASLLVHGALAGRRNKNPLQGPHLGLELGKTRYLLLDDLPLPIGIGPKAAVEIGDDQPLVVVGRKHFPEFGRDRNASLRIDRIFESPPKHKFPNYLWQNLPLFPTFWAP